MDAGMDTGPILLQWETPIAADESAPGLAERMSVAGAELMMETLAGIATGQLKLQSQDGTRATKAPLLKKEDGLIDWAWSAAKIYNRLRGFDPWPGIFTTFQGKRIAITAARPMEIAEPDSPARPGTILSAKERIIVSCGEQSVLAVTEFQPEGRRRMTARDFSNGAKLIAGNVFGG